MADGPWLVSGGAVLLLDVLAKGRDRAPPMDPAKYESDHSWLARL